MTLSMYLCLTLYCIIGKHLSLGQSELAIPENGINYPISPDNDDHFDEIPTSSSSSDLVYNLSSKRASIKDHSSLLLKHWPPMQNQYEMPESESKVKHLLMVGRLIPHYQFLSHAESNSPNVDNSKGSEMGMHRITRLQPRSQGFLRFGRMNKRPQDPKEDTAFLRFGRTNLKTLWSFL